MTEPEETTVVVLIYKCLHTLQKEVHPTEYRSVLLGIMASAIGNVPDDYWNEMKKCSPCGTEGCECHITISPYTVAFLTLLREDFKKNMKNVTTV